MAVPILYYMAYSRRPELNSALPPRNREEPAGAISALSLSAKRVPEKLQESLAVLNKCRACVQSAHSLQQHQFGFS